MKIWNVVSWLDIPYFVYLCPTLREFIFADFADFGQIRENLFLQKNLKISRSATINSRKFLKILLSAKISFLNLKKCDFPLSFLTLGVLRLRNYATTYLNIYINYLLTRRKDKTLGQNILIRENKFLHNVRNSPIRENKYPQNV